MFFLLFSGIHQHWQLTRYFVASGLGFGCVYIATNLYVAECAPTRLRGSFVGTVAQFGYQLGTLIAFWAGYGMSFHKSPYNIAWRVSNIIQIPIGLTFILVSFFYPESPRHLLEKYPESPDRVLLVLARLRSSSPTDEAVRAEFHELVASREYRRRYDPGYVGLFKNKAMRKRLLLGFYAAGLQQVSQTGTSTVLKPTTEYFAFCSVLAESNSSVNSVEALQRSPCTLL